jgi:hypothetical protein
MTTANTAPLAGLLAAITATRSAAEGARLLVEGLADITQAALASEDTATLDALPADLRALAPELAHALHVHTPVAAFAEAEALPSVQTLGPADGVPTPAELAAQERGEVAAEDTIVQAVAAGPVPVEPTPSDLAPHEDGKPSPAVDDPDLSDPDLHPLALDGDRDLQPDAPEVHEGVEVRDAG